MNRIESTLERLRSRGEKALGLFVTAGFPGKNSTPQIAEALEEGGADFLELGMPFSDPLADGPVIQESSAVSLTNGTTVRSILNDVEAIRRRSDIPIILMGYCTPVLAYGEDNFFADAGRAGVDGVILPEVPLEEFDRFGCRLERNGLAGILLVTPLTSGERIEAIDARSRGFLYCVSGTGVTGARKERAPAAYFEHLHRHVRRNPLLAGFGVSSPDDARAYGPVADGVIVGSALVRFLRDSPGKSEIAKWVGRYKLSMIHG
jgi:tryptophan synthase alpha chain